MKSILAWIGMVGAVVIIWQGALTSGLVSPAVLASPGETIRATPTLFKSRGDLPDLWSTFTCSLLAFLVSVPVGIACGVAVHGAGDSGRPWEFVLDFLRSTPATALVPVFLIVFGLNNSTKVMVGAFSSALVIAMATSASLNGRNRTRMGIAALYGLTPLRRLLWVALPEILPQLFVGFKAGISLALVLVVVSEMMIGGDRGLGRVIADMRYTDDKPRLYAAIAATGAIGYLFNVGLRLVERSLIHWKGF
jgi:NitT/TauT family transport system permease protein